MVNEGRIRETNGCENMRHTRRCVEREQSQRGVGIWGLGLELWSRVRVRVEEGRGSYLRPVAMGVQQLSARSVTDLGQIG